MEFFKVNVEVDQDGFIHNKYGGNANAEFLDEDSYPDFSPKISWEKVPNAKSYALELIDYDSCPVIGKIFVHWIVGNIHSTILEENASRKNTDIIQGINSLTEGFLRSNIDESKKPQSNIKSSKYIGPMPPNGDHYYLFNVYALDIEKLDIKLPFFINDMHDAMRGHIVALGRCEFKYKQCKK
ncbi:YbhB/YbcL family Raf kinase inhibitor-like protein [Helicobacter cappadocius]|uniref:YbhB/YbcL family Raf kinase inhibitor-like protein n=1 Tax=Helicobacter cappadocius TaxID=3063998 RepID=A0AA90ST76_9HELI|nr:MULTISPECIES: YbhB/YbcL family Raf kinase inhibitor-like protein [unclassified Helicobacter]MDO7253760.1 YbhB/YbcL family Raf kinase inhibitor-like protein [Helicobacter sp. faydin-H75]MDP2539689.1 YbhB/YbcL family Raf kinase inhibitor-like protein [Helicobacter sp. faydin-H76]